MRNCARPFPAPCSRTALAAVNPFHFLNACPITVHVRFVGLSDTLRPSPLYPDGRTVSLLRHIGLKWCAAARVSAPLVCPKTWQSGHTQASVCALQHELLHCTMHRHVRYVSENAQSRTHCAPRCCVLALVLRPTSSAMPLHPMPWGNWRNRGAPVPRGAGPPHAFPFLFLPPRNVSQSRGGGAQGLALDAQRHAIACARISPCV